MNKESRNAFMVVGAVLVALLAIGLIFSGGSGDAIVGDAPVAAHDEGEEVAAGAEGEAPAAVADTEDEATASPEMAEDAGEVSPEDVTEVTGLAPGPEESQAGEPTADAIADPGDAEATAAGAEESAPGEQAAAEDAATEEAATEEAATEEAATEEETDGAAGAGGETLTAALAGDPEAGASVFRQCQACHQIGEGAGNRVGPQLNGVVGRPIASVEDFTYSDSLTALGQEGREWTPDELRGFLANPREYVPGTSMAYAGVRSEDDLENLIAHLASFE